jgi:hypothetical protein
MPRVGLAGKECLHGPELVGANSKSQGCVTLRVGLIDIGAGAQQEFHDLCLPPKRRHVEGYATE